MGTGAQQCCEEMEGLKGKIVNKINFTFIQKTILNLIYELISTQYTNLSND